jgi:hypothetical protein
MKNEIEETLKTIKSNCYIEEMDAVDTDRLAKACFDYGKAQQKKEDNVSELMKDLNRVRKQCKFLMTMNSDRKNENRRINRFLTKLLEDGRITKEELRLFSQKRPKKIKQLESKK